MKSRMKDVTKTSIVAIIGDSGRRVTLNENTVLKSGGEAIIHKDPDHPNSKAIKIYHEPDKDRGEKLNAFLQKFQFSSCSNVIAPLYPAKSLAGDCIGFQMRQLNARYRILNLLFKSQSFREDYGFTTKVKADLFLQIGVELKDEIHNQGLIAGDLNSANIMIHDAQHTAAWIDVDSMQFGNYPCCGGTSLYLHPALYGIDLSRKPIFKKEYDWWSYTVLLCQALLNGIHPFKSGLHQQWKSPESRAANGATFFDSDVKYPEKGLPPEILTDELIEIIVKILKRQNQEPFPLQALKEYSGMLIRCNSCGVWYPAGRPNCPSCTQITMLDMAMAAKVAGFNVIDLIITQGRILHYQTDGDTIYCIVEENGNVVLYKKEPNRNTVRFDLNITAKPGARYGIFSGLLVICADPAEDEPKLFVVDIKTGIPKPFKQLTTMTFSGGQAVFSFSKRFLYRIAGRTVLCGERFGDVELVERQVMQVFEGQTWFTVAPDMEKEFVIGFHRQFTALNWFLLKGDAEGRQFTRLDLDVPQLDKGESLKDLSVRFSSSILIMRKTTKRGNEIVHLDIVSADDGKVVQSAILNVSDATQWDNIHGKVFWKNFVMHATDNGIIKEDLRNHTADQLLLTAKYVSGYDLIDRLGANILVVKNDRIVLITK